VEEWVIETDMDGFAESTTLLSEKTARGIEQLDRGEVVPGEVVRARLQERKVGWLKNRSLQNLLDGGISGAVDLPGAAPRA
jgi:hypothetical protein